MTWKVPKVALISQPPEPGGSLALVKFLYQALVQSGRVRPCVLSYWLPTGVEGDTGIPRIVNTLRRSWFSSARVFCPQDTGMDWRAFAHTLSALEPPRFMPTTLWESALRDVDACVVVGGSVLAGYPAARSGVRYIAWVGTPFWEDRIQRVRSAGILRRFWYLATSPALTSIERSVSLRSSKLMVQSAYTMRLFRSRYRVPSERMIDVPCPVDTEFFRPGAERPRNSVVKIVSVGRFSDPRKNLALLLEAFDILRRPGANPELTVVGVYNRDDITAYRSRWPSTAEVRFLGFVSKNEKRQALQQADIFVCSSQQEGFGIAIVEAMACGLPVVSTRCGGPESIISDGQNGLLVRNGDANALANAVEMLCEDGRVRSQLGMRARANCQQRYSKEAVQCLIFQAMDEVWNLGLVESLSQRGMPNASTSVDRESSVC